MELLSPAGAWDAMAAAVQAGADAVYLGCGTFNARRNAKNFSWDELPRAVAYCHLRGVKLYFTLNTLLTDRELPQGRDALIRASEAGVDAVIIQDWGLLALARETVPDLPLHGSTQMTIHSLRGVEEAARRGLHCAVISRELSREDIAAIARHSPIPLEVFVHGALCMSVSGQCALSAAIGGRSGNRGLCAQPCRLPYRLDSGKTGYPLSLKDLNLAAHLEELREMGIAIIKLEGRMKRPDYVGAVTGVYAACLRERRAPIPEEERILTAAFSRQGFTDGYWQGHTGPAMFGIREKAVPENASKNAAGNASAILWAKERTVPITLSAALRRDTPFTLTVADGDGHSITVQGAVPEPARTRPVTADELKKQLGKTGGTVFRIQKLSVQAEDGLSLPVRAINGLRREALEQLAVRRVQVSSRRILPLATLPETEYCQGEKEYSQREKEYAQKENRKELAYSVSLALPFQLTRELTALAPARIILPAERIPDFDIAGSGFSGEWCVALPRFCKDNEEPILRRLLEQARDKGVTSAAINNLGQVSLAREMGFILRGDTGLNLFNSRSLRELAGWGLASATASFELRWEQIRDINPILPLEALVYGRLPLMLTANCCIANGAGCSDRNLHGSCGQPHALADRRGEQFPLLPVFGCRNELENSKTLYLADKPLAGWGLAWGRLRFTTETAAQCVTVLAQYQGRQSPVLPEDFTRGLYFRGVE